MTPGTIWLLPLIICVISITDARNRRRNACLYTEGSDCCHFVSSADVRAGQFECQGGLAWNQAACSCDWARNVPDCQPQRDCNVSTAVDLGCLGELQEEQCCFGRKVYTRVDIKSYRRAGDAKKQRCPLEQTFNLESCSCLGHISTEDFRCTHWTFDDSKRSSPQGVSTRGTGLSTIPGLRRDALRLAAGGNLTIDRFAKAWLGHAFTIGLWLRLHVDTRGVTVYSNGDDSDLDRYPPSIFLLAAGNPVALSGGIRTKSQLNGQALVSDFTQEAINLGEWTFVVYVYDDPQFTLYVSDRSSTILKGGELVVSDCPLVLGGESNQGMDIDELIFCDVAWTSEQVNTYKSTGTIPTP